MPAIAQTYMQFLLQWMYFLRYVNFWIEEGMRGANVHVELYCMDKAP